MWNASDLPTDHVVALWQAITCPMLLLWGKDSFASSPGGDARLDYLPTARLIEYEDAGHWLHYDQFARFMQDLRAFLSRTPASGWNRSGPEPA